jgi:hypothetical protein
MERRQVGAVPEWQPEPRPRVDAQRVADHPFGVPDVRLETLRREQRHPGVIEGVTSDEVRAAGHSARGLGVRLHPAALDEERGPDLVALQAIEQSLLDARVTRAVRMLGVECQGDSQARYFSTPVMTMPRMNTRWKAMNRRTGTSRVMIVPAWM